MAQGGFGFLAVRRGKVMLGLYYTSKETREEILS